MIFCLCFGLCKWQGAGEGICNKGGTACDTSLASLLAGDFLYHQDSSPNFSEIQKALWQDHTMAERNHVAEATRRDGRICQRQILIYGRKQVRGRKKTREQEEQRK